MSLIEAFNSSVDPDLYEAEDATAFSSEKAPSKKLQSMSRSVPRPSLLAYANEVQELVDARVLTPLSFEESRRQLDTAISNARKLKERAQAKVKAYSL